MPGDSKPRQDRDGGNLASGPGNPGGSLAAASRADGSVPIDLAEARFRVKVLEQLNAQSWRCAYPCQNGIIGGKLLPGEPLAKAYDNTGLVHLDCAKYTTVPTEGNPWQSQK